MMSNKQRGGTLAGLIVGVVIGLAIALIVAVYVSKVPVPFLNGASRLVEQDANEAQRNKDWNPNAPLSGRNAAKPAPPATPATGGIEAPAAAGPAGGAPAPAAEAGAAGDPLGDLARARAQGAAAGATAAATAPAPAPAGSEPYAYFIQAGAFRGPDEANAQRAQLAMLGWEARVTEGQQNGRPVYRVRIGPFARRDDAEQFKGKLDGEGVAAILVRVAR